MTSQPDAPNQFPPRNRLTAYLQVDTLHQYRKHAASFTACAMLSSALLTSLCPARAEIIPDNTLGSERSTVVPVDALRDQIHGGAQRSSSLFHSFQDFNIETGRAAYFTNPAGIQNIFSRVTGSNPSHLFGTLGVLGNANLFFLNPNGILFGPDAQLDLRGSFIATTADRFVFPDGSQFSARNPQAAPLLTVDVPPIAIALEFEEANGSIVNAGNLTVAPGQTLSLIARNLANTGSLTAPAGKIALFAVPEAAAGELQQVQLDSRGQLLGLSSSITAPNATTDGTLAPPNLTELLAVIADHPDPSIATPAQTLLPQTLPSTSLAPTAGTTLVSGHLNVSASPPPSSALSPPSFGKIQVLGDRVALFNASLEASGETGGGTILVGGDYQGKGSTPTARRTFVSRDATIRADALEQGDGGRAIVWANEATSFHGNISARGGVNGGDGGFIEVSGKEHLVFDGEVDVSAAAGNDGTVLFDPRNIRIIAGTGMNDSQLNDAPVGQILFGEDIMDDFEIGAATLENIAGEIVLQATNDIIIDDGVSLNFISPGGMINFTADAEGNGVGSFLMNPNDTIDAAGRDVTISGASITTGDINTSGNTGLSTADAGGSIALTANNGSIATGNLVSSSSKFALGPAKSETGGTIILNANRGNIVTGKLESYSSAVSGFGSATAKSGGAVTLNADGNITTDLIDISSVALTLTGNAKAGSGGTINLTANGKIAIGDINSNSFAAGNDEPIFSSDETSGLAGGNATTGSGGSIHLQSRSDMLTGSLNTSSRAFASNQAITASGGAMNLQSLGSISTKVLDSASEALANNQATAGSGGAMGLIANGNIATTGLNASALAMTQQAFDIFAETMALSNGAELRAEVIARVPAALTSASSRKGGNLTLHGGGNIDLQGDIRTTGGFIARSRIPLPTGDGGTIDVRAGGNLNLTEAVINTSGRSGGRIELHSNQAIAATSSALDSNSAGGGNGRGIHLAAPLVTWTENIGKSRLDSSTYGSGRAGDFTIDTHHLRLRGTLIATSTYSAGQSGRLTINATEFVELLDNQRFGSALRSSTEAEGNAGDITVNTKHLKIQGGSRIIANTFTAASGRGGNVTVNASDRVDLSGFVIEADGDRQLSELGAGTRGSGNAGRLTVNTRELMVSEGAVIQTGTAPQSRGQGGTMTINASELVELKGTALDGAFSSSLRSDSLGSGDGGKIQVNTRRLIVQDGAVISSSTLRRGKGGTTEINVSEIVELRGTAPGGHPSGIFALAGAAGVADRLLDQELEAVSPEDVAEFGAEVFANLPSETVLRVRPDLAGVLLTRPPATGQGGNLNLQADRLIVKDGAQVSVSGQFAKVDAGNIKIEARSVLLNRGAIVAETASGEGGNIGLRVPEVLLLRHGSTISTTAGTAQAGGNGGNIDIDAGFVVAVPGENSDITANAFNGNGGKVRIRAQGILGLGARSQLTPWSDITASSQFGVDGTVTLDVLAVDPSRGLGKLPQRLKQAELDRGCDEPGGRGSVELYDIGRGGMAIGPEEPLQANSLLGTWIPLVEDEGKDTIAEATQMRASGASAIASLLPPCKARGGEEVKSEG